MATRRTPADKSTTRKKKSAQQPAAASTSETTTPTEVWGGAVPTVEGLVKGNPRQTLPTNANVLGALPWAFLPRRQYQDLDLTSLSNGSFAPQQIMELLADAWPDVALALWNWMRLCAAEYELEVRAPDNTTEDAAGKALLDAFLERVNPHFGGFRAVLEQWVMTVSMEGACAGECLPTPEVDAPQDLLAVQPWTIYFQRALTQAYIPFQWQPMLASGATGLAAGASSSEPGTNVPMPDPTAPAPATAELLVMRALDHGGFRRLNPVTFAYVPLDAVVDDPYGRMPFAAVMQLIAFDAELLKDLRQWAHVNAYGRLDVQVLAESAEKLMPPAIRANPAERIKWLVSYLSQIQTAYNGLNPDDTFIHWDNVVVSGVDSAGQTMNIDNLIRVVERRMFRALKQLPILMGSNEGTTETWGTLQMEVYALGIQSIQRTVAACAEHLLDAALRLLGSTSRVHFAFKPLRASDRLKLAIAERQEIANEAAKRDEGWQTQDEASQAITGSAAVLQKGPAVDPVAAVSGAGGGEPNAATTDAPDAAEPEPGADTDAAVEATPGMDAGKDAGKAAPAKATTKAADAKATAQRERYAVYNAMLQVAQADATRRQQALVRTGALNPTRTAQAASLQQRMADRFRGLHLRPATLRQVRDLHTSRAVATARSTHPTAAAAIGKLADVWERKAALLPGGGDDHAPDETPEAPALTPDERDALVGSIAVTLARDLPNEDAALNDTLATHRRDAFTSAGQAALERLGIVTAGGFALTNPALTHKAQQTAKAHGKGIQQTTRTVVAVALVNALLAGTDDLDALAAVADASFAHMADAGVDALDGRLLRSRAASIGDYETGDAWGWGSVETWGRNGVPEKAWTTNGHPDPGSAEKPCQDNEDAGSIPITASFPSGADWAPEHPTCYCTVDAITPDDYAAPSDPWTGA